MIPKSCIFSRPTEKYVIALIDTAATAACSQWTLPGQCIRQQLLMDRQGAAEAHCFDCLLIVFAVWLGSLGCGSSVLKAMFLEWLSNMNRRCRDF